MRYLIIWTQKQISKNKLLFPLILIFVLQLMYVYPFLSVFNVDVFKNNEFVLIATYSIVYAILNSLIIILISFYLSVIFCNHFNSIKGIHFMLIPVLLGNVIISYSLSRYNVFSAFAEQRNLYGVLLSLLLTNIYQYGSLGVVLFVIKIRSIPNELIEFVKSNDFSFRETLSEVILPNLKNLIVLLFIMIFILTFNEFSKVSILFRSSKATNTEFISHFIERTFRNYSVVNIDYGISKMLDYSMGIVLIFLTITFIFYVLTTRLKNQNILTQFIYVFNPVFKKIDKKTSLIVYILFLFATFLPIIIIVFDLFQKPDNVLLIDVFLKSIPLYLTASIFISSIFIICSINLKLYFPQKLTINDKYYSYSIWMLYLYRVIPAITLGFLGIVLMSNFGISKYMLWIIGETILLTPFVFSFLVYINADIMPEEIHFVKRNVFSYYETFKNVFLGRNSISYLLVFLFTFGFIWNEDTLTYAIRDKIPTPVVDLINNSVGKHFNRADAAYSALPLFIVVSIFLYFFSRMNLVLKKK